VRYEQPAPAAPPVAAAEPAYRSPRGPAGALRWLFYTLVGVDAVAIAAAIVEHRFYSRYGEGESVDEDAELPVVLFSGLVALAQGALYVAVIVLFIVWFHRAYSNLPALGATHLRWGTGWAIGAWFVPILNLWRPKQIANDIWRASDPQTPPQQGASWRERDVPAVFQWWWAAYLVTQWIGNGALRASLRADTPSELARSAIIYALSDAFDILAALLAIAVVRRTTARQDERAARLDAATLGAWTTEPPRSPSA
jgi:Domain of unknown function (DUF4328)